MCHLLQLLLPFQHPALTGIGLRDCEAVTDAGLTALQDCTHLAAVDLLGCSEVTDKGLALLIAACKDLQPDGLESPAKGDLYCEALVMHRPGLATIDLKNSSCLTDKGLEAIAGSFESLVGINMDGCTEVGVVCFVQTCCHSLVILWEL